MPPRMTGVKRRREPEDPPPAAAAAPVVRDDGIRLASELICGVCQVSESSKLMSNLQALMGGTDARDAVLTAFQHERHTPQSVLLNIIRRLETWTIRTHVAIMYVLRTLGDLGIGRMYDVLQAHHFVTHRKHVLACFFELLDTDAAFASVHAAPTAITAANMRHIDSRWRDGTTALYSWKHLLTRVPRSRLGAVLVALTRSVVELAACTAAATDLCGMIEALCSADILRPEADLNMPFAAMSVNVSLDVPPWQKDGLDATYETPYYTRVGMYPLLIRHLFSRWWSCPCQPRGLQCIEASRTLRARAGAAFESVITRTRSRRLFVSCVVRRIMRVADLRPLILSFVLSV
jgi:hypothetical protein